MKRFVAAFALLLASLAAQPAMARAADKRPVTILISIDGFRPDYISPALTPTLSAISTAGVAGTMRPSFPSVTFPNHWTLATGLRPDRHGIVNGAMLDPAHPGVVFGKASEQPWWWDAANPVWIDAEAKGITTGIMFWPGSTVAIGGRRASNWQAYHAELPNMARAEVVLDWMRRPAAIRPRLVLMYFGDVDVAGHHHGPASAEVKDAIHNVDAAITHLRQGLKTLHQPVNLVIVSDHGMAATDPARTVWMKDYVSKEDYQLISYGGNLFINDRPGHEAALAAALAKLPASIHCWRKGDLPERFHFGKNPRVSDWFCLPEPGVRIMDGNPDRPSEPGDHGYDPDSPDMRALFLATGPAFRPRVKLETFDNVDVEPLIRDLIGLPPRKERDGDDAVFRPALRR